jgi:hypothetical protein
MIDPVWESTASFTILVPKPVPPAFRLMTRFEKRLSRTSGDIPRPVSLTDRMTTSVFGSNRPSTVIDPPEGVSGIALLMIVEGIKETIFVRLNHWQLVKVSR